MRLPSAGLLLTLLLPACTALSPREPGFPLRAALDSVFRTVKPELETVRLVSLRIGPWWGDSVAYALVATAIGPHRGMDSLGQAGEIFGVFLVDSAFTRLTRTLEVFRSPRQRDYDVWIARTTGDSIIVCGRGISYGDQTERRAYPLEYPPATDPVLPGPGSADQADGVGSLEPDCRFH